MAQIICHMNFINRDWQSETVTLTYNVNIGCQWLQKKMEKIMFRRALDNAYKIYKTRSFTGFLNLRSLPAKNELHLTHKNINGEAVIEHAFNHIDDGVNDYIFSVKLIK